MMENKITPKDILIKLLKEDYVITDYQTSLSSSEGADKDYVFKLRLNNGDKIK